MHDEQAFLLCRYDLAQVNFWQEIDGMLPLLGQKPHILVVPGQVLTSFQPP